MEPAVRVELDTGGQVRRGADVALIVRVTNTMDRPVDLYLTGRPVAFDVIVSDAGGRVWWRRLEGRTIAMALRLESLAPGASLVLSDRWDQRSGAGETVPVGDYQVRAEVFTESGVLRSVPHTLRIVD